MAEGELVPPAAAKSSAGEKLLWALLSLAIAGLVAFAAAERIERARAPELQVLARLPEFRLVNRDGRQIGSAELAGKPFIADFVFTSCPGVCPVLSKRLGELARELPLEQVNLVSFTVDPENDTPAALAAYAEKLAAPPQWYFLTGEKAALYALIRGGFQLVVDDSKQAAASDPILHSNRFVLVDGDGQIRGYYNAFEPAEVDQLRLDLRRLLR
jgi:protein SCO1/2